jgi:hypothetical protein
MAPQRVRSMCLPSVLWAGLMGGRDDWETQSNTCSLRKEKKKTFWIGLSILHPNFSEIAIFVEIWAK